MRSAWALALYSLMMRAAVPALMARLAWRGRTEAGYRRDWAGRLGFWPPLPPAARCWIHAVSLGETRAAAPLIAALRQAMPELKFVLTCGTATGREAGRALLEPGDVQGWIPLDTPGAVSRFLRAVQPGVGVLMETETWPNLLAQAQRLGIPMVLANARLSERSLRKGLRWPALARPMMARLSLVLAQTQADARRLREAGAGSVKVVGNLKFDVQPDPVKLQAGRTWREALDSPVVLAASWREGEDADLMRVWRSWPDPRPHLLVVPRHPQRFDEVARMWQEAGWKVDRRSLALAQGRAMDEQAQIWVGDTLGDMPFYYGCADVALLGGSFAPLGGQNLIEAAACGCPVVTGPHTFNFLEAAEQAVAAGAACRVVDLGAALTTVQALLTSDQTDGVRDTAGDGHTGRLAVMREAAGHFASSHRGATALSVQALWPMLRAAAGKTGPNGG